MPIPALDQFPAVKAKPHIRQIRRIYLMLTCCSYDFILRLLSLCFVGLRQEVYPETEVFKTASQRQTVFSDQ